MKKQPKSINFIPDRDSISLIGNVRFQLSLPDVDCEVMSSEKDAGGTYSQIPHQ